MREFDVRTPDGGTLHGYDDEQPGVPVLWHHGTPNLGTPPAPLAARSAEVGLRWIGYDRPGYGGSTPRPGRRVGDAAADAVAIADALGLGAFAVAGHSGGGPHALACAATLGDRVRAVLAVASLAPRDADGLDFYGGMIASGCAALQAAEAGRDAKLAFETCHGDAFDPEFTAADLAALRGAWSWFDSVVGPALAGGPDGAVDDDVAYVMPWGADPAAITAPVLLLHGVDDGIAPVAHARWLAGAVADARLQVVPDAGHIAVLTAADAVLPFLAG